MSDDDPGKIEVCRLWLRDGARGEFLSGVLGGLRVLIVPNGDKADEDDADFIMVFAQNNRPQPRRLRKETPS